MLDACRAGKKALMKCGQAPYKSSTAPWWPLQCPLPVITLTCCQLWHKEDGDKRDKRHQGDLSLTGRHAQRCFDERQSPLQRQQYTVGTNWVSQHCDDARHRCGCRQLAHLQQASPGSCGLLSSYLDGLQVDRGLKDNLCGRLFNLTPRRA